jgi:hypothetical protein
MTVTLRFLLLAVSAAMIAGGAYAEDGPVSTASQSTDANLANWLKDAPPVEQTGQEDVQRDAAPIQPDRKIHGEVGAAIGSGGYRSAYGIVNIPIGKNADATIAVSSGHADFRASRWGVGRGALGAQGCGRQLIDPATGLAVTGGPADPAAAALCDARH